MLDVSKGYPLSSTQPYRLYLSASVRLDGHHLKHWIDGGETSADNMTLLCTYHHRLLHEGGFSIAKDADGTLRFVTADGRTIPRQGYRLEDFVDDDVGDDAPSGPSREEFFEARQSA
jgi:hypothetical protein